MARTPHEVIDQADAAFNRGDAEAVLSYYEDHAVWVVKPGRLVSGKAALRKEFEGMFRTKPQVIKEDEHVIECGDIALCTIKWRLVGMGSDGSPLATRGCASTILRRQSDGRWHIVIDNPWGPRILDSDSQGV